MTTETDDKLCAAWHWRAPMLSASGSRRCRWGRDVGVEALTTDFHGAADARDALRARVAFLAALPATPEEI